MGESLREMDENAKTCKDINTPQLIIKPMTKTIKYDHQICSPFLMNIIY